MAATQPTARLLLFGGASLQGDRGPVVGRGAQRRRIALLAILAVARRPVSRDKLVAYLWEESDEEHARRLLSESIYVIRKSLGEDALVAIGPDIALNADLVWSDVIAFGDALAREDFTRAIDLYAGPFLDGFHVSDAPEFEHWVDSERDRFAREYAAVVQRVAEEAVARRDFASATTYWRKLAEVDPYNGTYAVALMRALDACGDRAGALQHARVHSALLRSEFDADPDAQVQALAEQLQRAPPPPAVPPSGPPLTSVLAPPVGPADEPAQPAKRTKTVWWILALLLVLTALAAIMASLMHDRPVETNAAVDVVAIMPFAVHGEETYLRDGMVDLLTTNLNGAGNLRTIDAPTILSRMQRQRESSPAGAAVIARRLGARLFVLGDVTTAGSQLNISASLYSIDAPADALARADEQGERDSLIYIVERLAAKLIAERAAGPGEQMTRLAAMTTSSYPALKDYLMGDAHFRAARYDSAVKWFERAVSKDTTFAFAYYRLSEAQEFDFDFLAARRAARRALEHSDRLSELDRALLLAWQDFLAGRAEQAEWRYNDILTTHPNHIEAVAGMGEVAAHFDPVRGQTLQNAERSFRTVLAITSEYGEVRNHSMEFAARHNNKAWFDSLFSALNPRDVQYGAWRAVRAFAWGDRAEQDAAVADLRSAEGLALGIAIGRVATLTYDFAGASRLAHELAREDRARSWRAGAHLMLAQLAVARGEWGEVESELAAARELEPHWSREFHALDLLHPARMAGREQLLRERTELETWRPSDYRPSTTFFLAAHIGVHEHLRLYLLGLLSLAVDDPAAADRYRLQLLRAGPTDEAHRFGYALARSLEGHLARAQGDRQRALQLLLGATIDAPPEFVAISPFYSRAHDRFVIAELQRELGHPAEAARWSQSLLDSYDFTYYGVAARQLGLIPGR